MKTFKRALTMHQSDSCTAALHSRCTCRCGGLLHGTDHKAFMALEQQVIKEQGYISADQVADAIYFLKEE